MNYMRGGSRKKKLRGLQGRRKFQGLVFPVLTSVAITTLACFRLVIVVTFRLILTEIIGKLEVKKIK